MENLRSEEDKIIKGIRSLFRLKRENNYTAVKDIRNLFRLKKEIKGIKSVRVNNFWSNNYTE